MFHVPETIVRAFPARVWHLPRAGLALHLTFDDGPHPEVTPMVLDLHDQHRAKATFFLVGENAQRWPELVSALRARGHAVGNHTHNHLDGWRTPTHLYLQNIDQARLHVPGTLFRPPYGRATARQVRGLPKGFRTIMWDVLSRDYDRSLAPERCAAGVLRHAQPGSIVVFHDSLKARTNLLGALPRVLDGLAARGLSFESLEGLEALPHASLALA